MLQIIPENEKTVRNVFFALNAWRIVREMHYKFAFVERSRTMKAPVGLLSDRTVLRQQDGGALPRQAPVYQISKSFHTSAGSDETAARSFCTLKPKGGFKCQTKPKNILHLPAKRQTAFRDGGSTGQNFWSQRHGCTNTVTRISWWSMPEDRRKCIPSMVTIMEISVYLEITKG